jgi:hypothetical protein
LAFRFCIAEMGMSDFFAEFLQLLSEEELIRFERRAELAAKPELAEAFHGKLFEYEQTEIIKTMRSEPLNRL